MWDYIKIGPSESGHEYVLMTVGKMSKLVEFTPTTAATAIPASKALRTSHGLHDYKVFVKGNQKSFLAKFKVGVSNSMFF